MQNNKSNYEKIILVISALAAIGTAGFLIWLSQGFQDQFVTQTVQEQKNLGDIPQEKADAALSRLQEKFNWISPVRENKPVPLNKSVLLIMKGGVLYDLLVDQPVFREPMSNEFLVKNDIPNLLSPNVGELDPDGDGFTNEEEFMKKTNPMDPSSKPPVTDKLFLKERIAHNYIIKLRSSNLPVQVQRLEPEPSRSKFVNLGEEFGFEKNEVRFRAESFEKKIVPGGATGEQDLSELKLKDLASEKDVVLVLNEPLNLAKYEARFVFRLGKETEKVVGMNETFQIPGVGTTYQVLEINEDNAVIVQIKEDGTRGEPLTVPLG